MSKITCSQCRYHGYIHKPGELRLPNGDIISGQKKLRPYAHYCTARHWQKIKDDENWTGQECPRWCPLMVNQI
ncbi:MAG: hypothetical protein QHH10_08100 [Peptococcaceae bacterium]|nr:hypothetical protein [Peptococcaceae bacterium]MDH7525255.1 hypothetical protein [Peptococcaceae bacterium]